jgi:hypothetical protein
MSTLPDVVAGRQMRMSRLLCSLPATTLGDAGAIA